MLKHWKYGVFGIVFGLLLLSLFKSSDIIENQHFHNCEIEPSTSLEVSAYDSCSGVDEDADIQGETFSFNGIVYTPIPRFSIEGEFSEFGTATFTVAKGQSKNKICCFLVNDGVVLYEFPDGYISGVHPRPDYVDSTKYEGAFYRDINEDSKEDIVIITYGAVGNFPQVTNLVTVFMQNEEGFELDDEISIASINEMISKTGSDEEHSYITIEDVCKYYTDKNKGTVPSS